MRIQRKKNKAALRRGIMLIQLFIIICLGVLCGRYHQLLKAQERELIIVKDLNSEKDQRIEEFGYQSVQLTQRLAEIEHPKGGIDEHGRLRVIGASLLDEHNNIVQLRGISAHGITWFPEYTNYQSLKTIKEYGASVFRIPMYVEQSGSYSEDPKLNRKLVYTAIENSLAADLYTIVDWHVLKDENPNKHTEDAKQFFQEVSARYPDNPGIIYEICNEPNGDTTWEDICDYANEVIPIIRDNSPNAIIIVGTPKYCTSVDKVIDHLLDYDNIVYAFHFYVGLTDLKYSEKKLSNMLSLGIPVFVSEWGVEDAEIAKNEEELHDFVTFLNDNNINWVVWSLSNKDESHSIIRSDCYSLHGWSADDLTEIGQILLQYMSE